MKRKKSNLLIDILTDKQRDIPARENLMPDVKAKWERMTRKQKAEAILREEGCRKEKKEDRFGDTKSGWWQDTVFLGADPVTALQALKG